MNKMQANSIDMVDCPCQCLKFMKDCFIFQNNKENLKASLLAPFRNVDISPRLNKEPTRECKNVPKLLKTINNMFDLNPEHSAYKLILIKHTGNKYQWSMACQLNVKCNF